MPEWSSVAGIPPRLALVVSFALLYMAGGRDWHHPWLTHAKVLRRWAGGVLLAGGTLCLSALAGLAHWWTYGVLGYLPFALSQGYGGTTTWQKILRRTLYGTLVGCTGLWFVLSSQRWELWLFQLGLAILASVWLGVRNIVGNAVQEETLIALLSTVMVPFLT